jgi:hypothetical protein
MEHQGFPTKRRTRATTTFRGSRSRLSTHACTSRRSTCCQARSAVRPPDVCVRACLPAYLRARVRARYTYMNIDTMHTRE